MTSTIKNMKEARAWQNRHNSLAPKVGDLAPDFELRDASDEHTVRLSDFQGRKPVALIFGSFT
jgi:peroxiredoxin